MDEVLSGISGLSGQTCHLGSYVSFRRLQTLSMAALPLGGLRRKLGAAASSVIIALHERGVRIAAGRAQSRAAVASPQHARAADAGRLILVRRCPPAALAASQPRWRPACGGLYPCLQPGTPTMSVRRVLLPVVLPRLVQVMAYLC